MAAKTEKPDFVKMHRLLQLFFLRRRGVRVELKGLTEIHLSAFEAHILHDLLTEDVITASYVSKVLRIEKSTLSRTLARMKDRGLIDTAPIHGDARSRKLVPTAIGRKLYEEMAQVEEQVMEECVKHLSRTDRQEIEDSLHAIATAGGVPVWKQYQSEHSFFAPIARINRLIGVFGSKFWNTSFTASDFQILMFLNDFGGSIKVSDLQNLLFLAPSALSKNLSGLAADNYIIQNRAEEDSRFAVIQMTDLGRQALEKINSVASDELMRACTDISPAKLSRFSQLLRLLVWPDFDAATIPLSRLLEMKCYPAMEDKTHLREFLVERLVASGQHRTLSETLFAEKGFGYGLFINKQLRAVCELRKESDSWILDNFFAESLGEGLIEKFLKKILNHRFGENQIPTIIPKSPLLPSGIVEA